MKEIINKIVKERTDRITEMIECHIKEGEKILDIGAGGGWIAKEIKKRKNADVVLLDTVDFNQTDLEHVLYDGETMPFPDNHFDVSLLIFVLHHCKNPLKVLAEAKRVSRNKIIIAEDIPTSFVNKIFLCFWDIFVGLPSLIKIPGENMPFNFKTIIQWQNIFNDFHLKLVFQKVFQSIKLIHHTLFVLQKES